jgi:putative transcriptional regulator
VNRVGKFLIARPAINLGFFKKSVVFIYEDSSYGTVGVNLTTPSNLRLTSIDPLKSLDNAVLDPIIYVGGPVNDRAVMMLHTDDFVSTNTLFTDVGLGISSDNLMVDKLFMGNWPKLFRLVVGASVWAPGQLDYEINHNSWLVSDLDHLPVFELSGNELWEWAIEHVGSKTMARYI